MKLPWDKKYLVISFHVVITLVAVYILTLCVDSVAFILTNVGKVLKAIFGKLGWVVSVCSPIVVAFIIAYIFDPFVDMLQRKYDIIYKKYIFAYFEKIGLNKKIRKTKNKKMQKDVELGLRFKSRTAGTALAYIIVFGVVIVACWIIYEKLERYGGENNIADGAMNFANDAIKEFLLIYDNLKDTLIKYGIFKYIEGYLDVFIEFFTSFIENFGNGIVEFFTAFGSGIINVIISMVIAFYFLRDKQIIKFKIKEASRIFLPKRFNRFITNALGDIHAVFSGYIRGQILDAAIMAVLISLGLSLVGVEFSVIIGIVSGFSNIIPYFGAFMAFILAVTVTLFSGTPIKALYAAIIILILQQIDGIIIGPKIVGENVNLSPVLVIIALAVAGEMFGLVGMILAVPVFAIIKMFLTRFFERQKMKKDIVD